MGDRPDVSAVMRPENPPLKTWQRIMLFAVVPLLPVAGFIVSWMTEGGSAWVTK